MKSDVQSSKPAPEPPLNPTVLRPASSFDTSMPTYTWAIAGLLTAVLLLGLLGFSVYQKSRDLDQAKAELEQAKAELAQVRAAAEKNQGEANALKEKLNESQASIEELQKQRDSAVRTHQTLEDEMRAALESKDVTISQLQGKLTVNILDRVLFDSGEADLKSGGAAVLRKVAAFLAQHPSLKVHVIGHTDNVPIRAVARKRFPSNWELSTARATAAVRFLTEEAGVDPRRLGAVGYGEFRPLADNATPEGRARNRRIAITILSEEMAGVDVPSIAGTNAPPPVPAPATLGAANVGAAASLASPGETNSPPQD